MATLKVFVDMMSQPSRSILLLLKANKIPFSPQVIDIAKGIGLLLTSFQIQFEPNIISMAVESKVNLPFHDLGCDSKDFFVI